MVKAIVEDAHELGISKIALGRLRGIREDNHKGRKANSMIHNFWSFRWIAQRFGEKAEEHGIDIVEVGEYKTSSLCPFCDSRGIRRHRGLFIRPNCKKAMNTDVVGTLNIAKMGKTILPSPSWDRDNGLMAQPSLLRWDGMMWEDKSSMKSRP